MGEGQASGWSVALSGMPGYREGWTGYPSRPRCCATRGVGAGRGQDTTEGPRLCRGGFWKAGRQVGEAAMELPMVSRRGVKPRSPGGVVYFPQGNRQGLTLRRVGMLTGWKLGGPSGVLCGRSRGGSGPVSRPPGFLP